MHEDGPFRHFDAKPAWLVPALPDPDRSPDPQGDWEYMTPRPYKRSKTVPTPPEFLDSRCSHCGARNGEYHHAECELHFIGYETPSGWLHYSRAQVHYNVRHGYQMALDRNIGAAKERFKTYWQSMVREGLLPDPEKAQVMFKRMKVEDEVESLRTRPKLSRVSEKD